MALTTRRWILIALVGFALIPVLVLRPVEERTEPRLDARARLARDAGVAKRRTERAAESAYLLRLHDSVRTSLARATAPGTYVDRAINDTVRTLVEDIIRDISVRRPAQPRVPVDIVVVLDTASKFRGYDRQRPFGVLPLEYLLPREGSSDHCVVLARLNSRARRGDLLSVDVRERFLGPCAFYEAYGPPGSAVRRWLDDRGWRFARYGVARSAALPRFERSDAELDRNIRRGMSQSGFQCWVGVDSACVATISDPNPMDRARIGPQGSVLPNEALPFLRYTWYERAQGFGPRQSSMLADMAARLGPEKFSAFWTSSLAPTEAFSQASGQAFPAWVREWLNSAYRPQRTGPGMSAPALVFCAFVLIGGCALALFAAERRQVA